RGRAGTDGARRDEGSVLVIELINFSMDSAAGQERRRKSVDAICVSSVEADFGLNGRGLVSNGGHASCACIDPHGSRISGRGERQRTVVAKKMLASRY